MDYRCCNDDCLTEFSTDRPRPKCPSCGNIYVARQEETRP